MTQIFKGTSDNEDITRILAPASLYFTAPEADAGKFTLALGIVNMLASAGLRVGVFRPISPRHIDDGYDDQLAMLLEYATVQQELHEATGVSSTDFANDPDMSIGIILDRYTAIKNNCDWVVVLGADYDDPQSTSELSLNAQIAANLQSPVVIGIKGLGRTVKEIKELTRSSIAEVAAKHAVVAAVIVNRVASDQISILRSELDSTAIAHIIIPEEPLLSAPTVYEITQAASARLLFGNEDSLHKEITSFLLAGMGVDNVLARLQSDSLVIVPGDRSDILIAVLSAHQSLDFPQLSGVILSGNIQPAEHVLKLAQSLANGLPVFISDLDSYQLATVTSITYGSVASGSMVKVQKALELIEQHMLSDELINSVRSVTPNIITPQIFEFQLLQQARSQIKHIVLPEGDDDRILQSAAIVLVRNIAQITILGNPNKVHERAQLLGIDLTDAQVVDPVTSQWREEFAHEYQRLRAHKGVTYEHAYEHVTDVSYFGTLMVHTNKADGMVSGAAHTTAHTIRPAFEIIKTQTGVSTVSSVFFMCLPDKVLAFGDCAIVPDPSVEQLADIAISSARTARQFGLEPRVALLSYSTGDSGSGEDVDKVRDAVHCIKTKAPKLIVDGPIQFDAAVDPVVAQIKLPKSPVAGKATVLIFPDLNAGNNTYKAVQRTAGAVAIGPVLQGINKPVNDLSRGALINDIVNTIAITAIQAQEVMST